MYVVVIGQEPYIRVCVCVYVCEGVCTPNLQTKHSHSANAHAVCVHRYVHILRVR